VAIDRADLLHLGTLAKARDHGHVLTLFKAEFLVLSSKERKENMLKRLEVSQLIEMLGLSGAIHTSYLVNIDDFENGNIEKAIKKMKQLLTASLGNNVTESLINETVTAPPEYEEVNQLIDDDVNEEVGGDMDSAYNEDFVNLSNVSDMGGELESLAPPVIERQSPLASSSLFGLMKLNY
jgi:hypothetical protein